MGNVQICCGEKVEGADKKDAVVSSTAAEGSVKLATDVPVLQKPIGDGSVAVATEDGSGTAAKPEALRSAPSVGLVEMLGSQTAVDLSQDPTASAVGSAGAAEVAESGRLRPSAAAS